MPTAAAADRGRMPCGNLQAGLKHACAARNAMARQRRPCRVPPAANADARRAGRARASEDGLSCQHTRRDVSPRARLIVRGFAVNSEKSEMRRRGRMSLPTREGEGIGFQLAGRWS